MLLSKVLVVGTVAYFTGHGEIGRAGEKHYLDNTTITVVATVYGMCDPQAVCGGKGGGEGITGQGGACLVLLHVMHKISRLPGKRVGRGVKV